MRAVAISIDNRGATSAGGFILPNDRVDVIQTVQTGLGERSGPAISEIILANIRVLAIGQNVQERNGEKVVTGETATLELTPRAVRERSFSPRRSGSSRSCCAASPTSTKPARRRGEERQRAPGDPLRRPTAGARTMIRSIQHRSDVRASCRVGRPARRSSPALALPALANGLRGTPTAIRFSRSRPRPAALARRVDLSIGRSLIVDLPRDAKEVFVANPKVANAVVRSTRKVFVIGVENGATSIFVMDAEGRQIATLEVNVGRDLNVLIQTLRTALPQAQVQVRPAGDSVLLTGSVASASEAQQAVDIANAFVGVSAGGGVARRAPSSTR